MKGSARTLRMRTGAEWFWSALLALLALAAAVGAKPVQAEDIRIGGTGSALATMARLGEAYRKVQGDAQVVIVPNLGSSGGIRALLARAVDLAVVSRPLGDKERAAGATSQVYGRTPFVFVTSRLTTGVSGVTLQQLIDIYSGTMTEWTDGTRVRLVLRPEADSDTQVLRDISPAFDRALTAAHQRPGLVTGATDHDSAARVESHPGTLGSSTLAFVRTEDSSLKPLAVDGIEPSAQALVEGRYRWYKTMEIVVAASTPPGARRFVEFVRSPAGRELLVQLGHAVD